MFSLQIQLPQETRRIEVPERQQPRVLTEVLRHHGIALNTRCGQRGLCDGCWVGLTDGQLLESLEADAEATNSPWVRGCQVWVPETGSATIEVPARSLLAHQPQVVASFRLNVPRAHDPLWQRVSVRSDEISTALPLSEALLAAVSARGDGEGPVAWGEAAGPLRPAEDGGFELALEHWGDHRIVTGCELSEPAYGLVADIGTTTVVVALVELSTGRLVANASALNAQNRMGDNVLTRINLCMTRPEQVQHLQRAVICDTLTPLVSGLVQEAGLVPGQLTCMVVAGNTTMLHLLLGIDPSSLGAMPFTPAFLEHQVVNARQLYFRRLDFSGWKAARRKPSSRWSDSQRRESSATGISLSLGPPDGPAVASDSEAARKRETCGPCGGASDVPDMTIHLLPGAAAYVGADITAGILASGMAYHGETCLLVDLGTNGELVLGHDGKFFGCATAAGPAFEGSGLAFGMRAVDGAISHVWLEEGHGPRVEVIGGEKAMGICGTAYVDFLARARHHGLISSTARFTTTDQPWIVQHQNHGRAAVIAERESAEPLLITEADMASLLQAKAAIAAGIRCLLKQANLQPPDVETIYLAGGFGFHMHVQSLIDCGLLPGFRPEQVETVGNTALAGAYLALVDSAALMEIRRVSTRMEIIELNREPEFEMTYIDELSLR
ncbi:MAG: ASKHA domain-containing protein [Planctomycetota bacterium]